MNVMEMFMLTAVNTKTGGLHYSTYLNYGLSGIAVIELIRQNRLLLEDGKLIVTNPATTGDNMLDEFLQAIASKPVPLKLNRWISLLPYKVKKQQTRVMERLEDNGILKIEQGRVLIFFPSRKYIVTNESQRDKIVNACRESLLKGNKAPAPEIMLIISIAAANYFISKFFTKDEYKGLKDTFKQLKKGTYFETGNEGIQEVVIAIQRAIAATQAAVAASGV